MIAAVLSAVVSAVFAGVLALRYARRRRPHQLVWTIGLAMFTLAAAAGVLARSGGATEAEYRLFYLFGAILNVAWLALGTTYLLAPRAARVAVVRTVAFRTTAAGRAAAGATSGVAYSGRTSRRTSATCSRVAASPNANFGCAGTTAGSGGSTASWAARVMSSAAWESPPRASSPWIRRSSAAASPRVAALGKRSR